jgi:hypothetical protein
MFKIKKSANKVLRPNIGTTNTKPPSAGLGVDSKTQGKKKLTESTKARSGGRNTGGMESLSYEMPTSMGPGSNVSSNAVSIDLEPMLMGLTPQVESAFYNLYRDIYYFDSVAGSAVDLISQVTFSSEFSLGGISNPKVAAAYEETIQQLNTRTLLPEMSTDHLVLGVHCSSLLYNKQKRVFADLMCHPVESLTITDIPFYSQDPIINVKFNAQVQAAVNSNSPSIAHLEELVGKSILEKIRSGSLDLDPLTTIYIPRKTFSYTEIGTSYYKRLLPWYLIEKNLYRGTLVESARRQRGILHLTLGDGDEWIPQIADMEFMTDLFMNADSDPLGAIIATRSGVSVEEIRQGGDFWKVTDFSDSVMPYKLRALGISEAFLTGDANYNVADASMTIFVEMLRSYRDMMTRKFFYERVFPLISMVHGYTVNAKGKVSIREEVKNVSSIAEALKLMNDGSKLLIPSVTWAKTLKPEGDSTYMELLNTLTEKGVPVPLRVLAAAGGLNLDELFRQKDDDLALRKQMQDYTNALKQFAPAPPDDGMSESRSRSSRLILPPMRSVSGASAVLQNSGGHRPPLLSREFNHELRNVSKTGKPKVMSSSVQRERNEKVNRLIVKALKDNQMRDAVAPTSFNANSKSSF